MTHSSLANFVPLSQREKVDVSAHYSPLIAHYSLSTPSPFGYSPCLRGRVC